MEYIASSSNRTDFRAHPALINSTGLDSTLHAEAQHSKGKEREQRRWRRSNERKQRWKERWKEMKSKQRQQAHWVSPALPCPALVLTHLHLAPSLFCRRMLWIAPNPLSFSLGIPSAGGARSDDFSLRLAAVHGSSLLQRYSKRRLQRTND
ncbi:hypothetical protein IWZ03DRAFT_206081 [Phyllosticta citriasiana]|uniref:Uncharacterized protein n=1 Tax=Phyllosticta citriasiana TaxID=595635 RepID=A0ABR1KNH7_9PEZI